jgi:hypothetical protein
MLGARSLSSKITRWPNRTFCTRRAPRPSSHLRRRCRHIVGGTGGSLTINGITRKITPDTSKTIRFQSSLDPEILE